MGYSTTRKMAELGGDRRGATLVEFALLTPLLLMLLMGIVGYGSWYLVAHGVQQAANDAARAALAGANAGERATIARDAAMRAIGRGTGMKPERATITVEDDGASLLVRIAYDAADNPALQTPVIPMPPALIRRDAAVRLEVM